MTIDDLLDGAMETDPDGYSREALRSMYGESRNFKFRGMIAMAKAVGVPASEFPEIRLAYAQMKIDESIQGIELAIANLDLLDPEGRLNPDDADIALPPIKGRDETKTRGKKIDEATKLARATEKRLRTDFR